ncbi:MAG: hypothetical protein K0Q87_1571 [Neobacillus sp.]|jgi:hypothetical protein|nr:hypothetical protein [Neobacillus sp.]
MFEYNEDYLRQRIKDLQEECKQYNTQHIRAIAKKEKQTSTLKKLVNYVIYFIG